MNRKIHLAALWLLLAGTPAPGQTGRTWSLEDCIDHAPLPITSSCAVRASMPSRRPPT